MKYVKLFEDFDTNENWYHNVTLAAASAIGSIVGPTDASAKTAPGAKVETAAKTNSAKSIDGIEVALDIQKNHTGDNLLCFDFVYKIISALTKTNNKTLRKDMAVKLTATGDMKLLEAIENGYPTTRGVQFALEKAGMGHSVGIKDAKVGDFVQFWHRELHMKHMYDHEQRAKDEKAGRQVPEKAYVYRTSSDQYYLRKDIKTPTYTSITMDAAKKLARTMAVELVDFDIWGHCAMVSKVGSDGTIYLAGSGHANGFSGTLFGEDSSWNKIEPNDPNLANAYFSRLNNNTDATYAVRK